MSKAASEENCQKYPYVIETRRVEVRDDRIYELTDEVVHVNGTMKVKSYKSRYLGTLNERSR